MTSVPVPPTVPTETKFPSISSLKTYPSIDESSEVISEVTAARIEVDKVRKLSADIDVAGGIDSD